MNIHYDLDVKYPCLPVSYYICQIIFMMSIYVSNSNNPENIICMSTISRGISYYYIHKTVVDQLSSVIQ